MSYLDDTILEMKENIMLAFQYLKNARTESEVTEQTQKLEALIKEKLVQSFKNGIEVGKREAKKAQGK